MKKLYRLSRSEDKLEWIECTGTEVKVEGYILYYVKNVKFYGYYSNCLIEPRTGISVAQGKTKNLCTEDFKRNLQKIGHDDFEKQITECIKKYGESPLYNKTV